MSIYGIVFLKALFLLEEKKIGKKKTHEEYVKELKLVNDKINILEEYKGSNINIAHQCNVCGYIWSSTPHNLLQGKGCPKCAEEKRGAQRRWTHDKYVKEVATKNPTIKVVGKYINANTKITHYCLVHDMYWDTTPSNILQGVGCPICHKERSSMARTRTDESYKEKLKKDFPRIIPIDAYIDAKTPILHKCLTHNIKWKISPDNILHGHGCPLCGNDKVREKNIKAHETYVMEVKEINPDIEVVDEYKGAWTPIYHQCQLDGYTWKVSPSNILQGSGCPQCNESIGERQVRQWLEKHNYIYTFQMTFDDCKDKKVLPFDFYLPDYNKCIEFDGQHHFKPMKYSNSMTDDEALQNFKITQKHDEIKNKYCKDNNIGILRIPYYKKVEDELNNFFLN